MPFQNEQDTASDPFDIEGQEAASTATPPETKVAEATTEDPPTPPDSDSDPVVIAVEVGEDDPKPTEEPTNPVVAEVDANPDDITDIVGPDGKYMTYKEAAKATRSLQSMYDKKVSDAEKSQKDSAAEVAKWNEWYQQQEQASRQAAEYEQQVAAATPSNEKELAYNIDVAPMDTFRQAVQFNPELVPSIIAHVRQTKGNHLADTMLVEQNQYQTALAGQQQQQAWEQQNQQAVQTPTSEANIKNAMDAIQQHYGDEFKELEEDVSKEVGTGNYNIDFNDPASIAGAVENAYLRVFREKAKAKMGQASDGPQVTSPQAETGSPGQAPVVSADDEIRNEIMAVKTTPWG